MNDKSGGGNPIFSCIPGHNFQLKEESGMYKGTFSGMCELKDNFFSILISVFT